MLIVLSLSGKPTKFEIDTGAEITFVSERDHQNIESPQLCPPWKTLRGQELSVKSQFTAKLRNSDREVEQELYVVKDLHRHLLVRPAIKALDLHVAAHVEAKLFALTVPHRVAIPLMQPVKDELERLGVIRVVQGNGGGA